ncbi:MAG: DUF4384 domain-containing protein [Rubrivivax sp.]|nr:DUF4384 domain-containing protein [Rubrivivax sp.]
MTPAADDDKTAFTPRELPTGGGATNFAPTAPVERTAIIPPPSARMPDGNGLPVGTRIGEFEITSMIGEGGFGIVYLANDTSLGRRVALKEYMPSSLAMRTGDSGVQVKSERYLETFEAGRKSFVNEARLLAQFDHPSLVKVYRFWESNGTAYMVMPFYEGKNLKDTLRQMQQANGGPPDETWLRTLLSPLCEALRVIHVEQCYHRDIAPDNVMMLAGSGRPLLLDFGAARRVIGDMTQALTVILKPGYAPIEQYAEIPGMRQGPWTDVYALAAVVYYAITGRTPPVSVGRMVNDNYQPLAQVAEGRYSRDFLEAVDRALVVRPENRTQTIEDFRDDLGLVEPGTMTGGSTLVRGPAALEPTRIAAGPPAAGAATRGPQTAMRPQGLTSMPRPAPAPAPAAEISAPPPGGPAAHTSFETTQVTPRKPPAPTPAPAARAPERRPAPLPFEAEQASEAKSSNRGLVIGAVAALVVAVAAGGYFATRGGKGGGAASSGGTAALPPAPAPAPTAAPAPAPGPAAPPAAQAPAPAPAPAPAAAPAAFDAVAEFDKALQAQSAAFGLNATTPKTTLRIGADQFRFTVQSSRGGHLYVLGIGPDGTIAQLVPNSVSGAVRLKPGQAWQFPAKDGFVLDAADPPGPSQLLVVVSAEARNFEAMKPRAEGTVRLFAGGADAAAAVAAHKGAGSAVAGRAACAPGAAACDEGYGAALLKFNVVR